MLSLKTLIPRARRVLATSSLLAVLIALPAAAGSGAPGPDDEVTFHLTDLGINQTWTEQMRVGDPFLTGPRGHHSVFTDSPRPIARILIPMPSDMKLALSPPEELAAEIKADLSTRIEAELANGVRDFEIQFVQHVAKPGYADPVRQAQVAKFGNVAYSAFGSVLSDLKQRTPNIGVDGTFASNGTTMFTKAVDSWKGFADLIQRVTWVDGRALEGDARRALDALGANKVRITNSYGDLPAFPKNAGFLHSIANHDVVRSLLEDYQDLTVFLLKPLDADKLNDQGQVKATCCHILSAISPQSRFQVEQFLPGDVRRDLGTLTGRDLHPQFGVPDYQRFGSAVPIFGRSHAQVLGTFLPRDPARTPLSQMLSAIPDGWLRVRPDGLRQFSENLRTAADDLQTVRDAGAMIEQGLKHAKSRIPGTYGDLTDLHDLISAIDADVARQSQGGFAAVSSHTLEAAARLGLSWVLDGDRLDRLVERRAIGATFAKSLDHLGHVDDLAAGLGRLMARGPGDAEGWTQVLDGLNKSAWYAVGYRISSGNRFTAETFAGLADLGARTGRQLTLPAIKRAYVRWQGVDKTLTAAYVDAQNLRVSHGGKPQTFEEYWHYDRGIIDLVQPRQLRDVNARFGLQSVPRSQWVQPQRTVVSSIQEHYRETCRGGFCARTELPWSGSRPTVPNMALGVPHQPAISGLPDSSRKGGVEIDPEMRSAGAAPSGLADQVLSPRPAGGGSSWDLKR